MIPCPVFFEAGDELVVGAALGFQLQCGGHGALAQARIQLLALGCSHEPRWIDLRVLKGGKALKLSPLFAQEAPEARDRLVAIPDADIKHDLLDGSRARGRHDDGAALPH